MLKISTIFPTVLIILDLAASAAYMLDHNVRMAVYWFAAAVLTVVVTF